MARRLSRRVLSHYVADVIIADGDVATAIQRLAAHLVGTGRTKEAAMIVRDIEFVLADKGTVIGAVTSAFDLSDATHKAIEQYVRQKTGADHVSLGKHVDPTVLGGVSISLPGAEIDNTIAHQLTVLKTRFKKV